MNSEVIGAIVVLVFVAFIISKIVAHSPKLKSLFTSDKDIDTGDVLEFE